MEHLAAEPRPAERLWNVRIHDFDIWQWPWPKCSGRYRDRRWTFFGLLWSKLDGTEMCMTDSQTNRTTADRQTHYVALGL